MSNEYGQSSNQRTEKIHKISVQTQRGRISSGSSDFIEYQSASSRILDTEPFIKRFYRNVVQFIFSQVSDNRKYLKTINKKYICTRFKVGVGSLIVGYTIFGAFMFRAIETSADIAHDHVGDINQTVHEAVRKLWVITNEYNLLNKR